MALSTNIGLLTFLSFPDNKGEFLPIDSLGHFLYTLFCNKKTPATKQELQLKLCLCQQTVCLMAARVFSFAYIRLIFLYHHAGMVAFV